MTNNVSTWLHGLAAAFIAGGASAVTTGFMAPAFAPNDLSFGGHPWKLLGMMGTMFIVTGVMGAAAYLKQSPVPVESTTTTVQTTVEVSSATVAGGASKS